MGGVGSFLFGKKPKAGTSESGNQAYDEINAAFKPAFGYTTGAGNLLSSLLGVGGGPAQTGALNNFANSGGMQFLMDQGNRMINSNQAARGLLNSGSTLKAIDKYGQGLGSTYLNEYLQNLFNLGTMGIQAGSLVSGAGQYSNGTTGTPGKTGALPGLIAAAAKIRGISDVRLKRDIVRVGTLADGLPVYDYKLFGKKQRGVMAHEVKQFRPEAFVPNIWGVYDGVDYSKIKDLDRG